MQVRGPGSISGYCLKVPQHHDDQGLAGVIMWIPMWP